MRRVICILITLTGLLLFHQLPALAVGSVDLIEKGAQFDGKAIDYEGEVIREVMIRGDHAWLNVNDGANALGVWVERRMIQSLRHYGSYRTKGDWIKITGIFHRSCPEHGGDMDIHAVSVEVLKEGRPVAHPIRLERLILAFIFMMGGTLFLIFKFLQRN